MSEVQERGACVETASFRVYRQADGRYIAFGTVDDGGAHKVHESGSHEERGDALAEVLQLSGFVG